MYRLLLFLVLSSIGFAQVNSSNVTWKSTVGKNFHASIQISDNYMYAMVGNLPGFSTRSLIAYDISAPVSPFEIQKRTYSEPNGSSQVVVIGDSLMYRNYNDISGFGSTYLRIYDINDGLLTTRSSIAVGSMGGYPQLFHAPGENYLFCRRNDGLLVVFDISDPYNPIKITPTGNSVFSSNDMHIANGHLYTASSTQLRVYELDFSATLDITLVNQIPIAAASNEFKSLGNTLYAALGSAGIYLYDISNPASPALLGSYDTPGSAVDIALDDTGDLAYVADNTSLQILDISDPANIQQDGYHLGIAAIGIEARNRIIAVMEQYSIGILRSNSGETGSINFAGPELKIIGIEGGGSVSRPAAIRNNGNSTVTVNGVLVEGAQFAGNDTTFTLAPNEEAFVNVTFLNPGTIGNYEGKLIVDHTGSQSPDTLNLVGETKADFLVYFHDPIPNTLVGSTRYSEVRLWNNGTEDVIIDSLTASGAAFHVDPSYDMVLSPTEILASQIAFSPIVVGQQSTTITAYYQGAAKTLTLSGIGIGSIIEFPADSLHLPDTHISRQETSLSYIKNTGNLAFEIFTIDFPSPPFQASLNGQFIAPGDSLTLKVDFKPLQAGTFTDSLVLDHSLPSSPTVIYLTGNGVAVNSSNMTLLGERNTAGLSRGIALSGNSAFLADRGNGIVAMDVANAQSITISGELPLPGDLHRFEISGNVGYAITEDGTLYSVNITNPSAMVLYDELALPAEPNDMVLNGNYAAISNGTEGLRIVNISDPTNLYQLSYRDLPGYSRGIAIAGNVAYVAGGDSGLHVVNLTDLLNPRLFSTLSMPGSTNEIDVQGNRLYVSMGTAGVQELDITSRLQPQSIRQIPITGETVDVAVIGDTLYAATLTAGVRAHSLDSPNAPEIAYYEMLTGVYSLEVKDGIIFSAAGTVGLYAYALAGNPLGVEDPSADVISEFRLHQNYPNPFNPETHIGFDLPQRSSVELLVYDLLGRKVRMLANGTMPAGSHQATWNGKNDAGQTQVSGVYMYQLQYETEAGIRGRLSGKMVLLK